MKGRIIDLWKVATFVPLRAWQASMWLLMIHLKWWPCQVWSDSSWNHPHDNGEPSQNGRIHQPVSKSWLEPPGNWQPDSWIRWGCCTYEIQCINLHQIWWKSWGTICNSVLLMVKNILRPPLKLPNFLVLLLASWVATLARRARILTYSSDGRLTVKWKEARRDWDAEWHGSTRHQWVCQYRASHHGADETEKKASSLEI